MGKIAQGFKHGAKNFFRNRFNVMGRTKHEYGLLNGHNLGDGGLTKGKGVGDGPDVFSRRNCSKGEFIALFPVLFLRTQLAPSYLISDILEAAQTGKWKYNTIRDCQRMAPQLGRDMGLSDDGIAKLDKLFGKENLTDWEMFSDADRDVLRQNFMDIAVEAGACINFK